MYTLENKSHDCSCLSVKPLLISPNASSFVKIVWWEAPTGVNWCDDYFELVLRAIFVISGPGGSLNFPRRQLEPRSHKQRATQNWPRGRKQWFHIVCDDLKSACCHTAGDSRLQRLWQRMVWKSLLIAARLTLRDRPRVAGSQWERSFIQINYLYWAYLGVAQRDLEPPALFEN